MTKKGILQIHKSKKFVHHSELVSHINVGKMKKRSSPFSIAIFLAFSLFVWFLRCSWANLRWVGNFVETCTSVHKVIQYFYSGRPLVQRPSVLMVLYRPLVPEMVTAWKDIFEGYICLHLKPRTTVLNNTRTTNC